MPTLFFADLVRELCLEGGTGPLTPTGAVPGHRRFAAVVPIDTPFHYAVAGVVHEGQWEAGLGRIDASGRLVRDTVAASSNGGAPVDFAPGLKTLALTVGADWFAGHDAAVAALETAVTGKQPLSTGHGSVATGAVGDTLTVGRDGGWVNIPLTALAYRDATGTTIAGAPLGGVAGSAAAPSLSFAADLNTGLFNAAADTIGFAAGGSERVRLTSTGLGVGVTSPYAKIEVVAAAGAAGLSVGAAGGAANTGIELYGLIDAIPASQKRGFIATASSDIGIAGDLLMAPRSSASASIRFLTGNAGAIERWRIAAVGTLQPGSDNSYDIGAAAMRVKLIYAATGTINTSDMRDKNWLGAPTAAELNAARRIAAELGFYQWLDAIAQKGSEGARRHFGVRAQAVWAIMSEEGLVDPVDIDGRPGFTPYGFLCWDEWEADGANMMRFGIRPDQLALFLIAGQEARIAALEAAA